MKRLLLGLLLAVLLASPAAARAVQHHNFGARTNATAPGPLSALSVYPGCVQPTPAAWSKKWYFAVSPLDGKTPADWTTAGVPTAQQGDINHPLYPIQNLFNFGSFPFTTATGWTTPLDGLNIYFGPPGNTIHQSFTTLSAMQAGDTGHLHLWPGDEVILRGHTGVNAGVWSINGVPGTASPIGGAASAGLDEVDDAGHPIHVYIHSDPGFPRPIFTTINMNSTVGIIVQGMNAYNTYDPSATASIRTFNWSTAQPTNGMTLNINEHVITWKTAPTLTDDVLIDPKGYQRTLIRTAESFQNSTDPLVNAFTITSQQSNFTLIKTYAANLSNGDTLNVNGVTWTFVTGAPVGNQVQIGASLSATLTAAVTAFKASALTAMKVFTVYGSTATTLTFAYAPAAQPANGTTLGLNGSTWTFVNTLTVGNQIQISPTNTTATIWETLGNAILAFDAAGSPWGTGVTYTTNNAGLSTIATTLGVPGIYKTQSTFPQFDVDSPINLSTFSLGGFYGIRTSASAIGPMHDNIIDDVFITSWDGVMTMSPSSVPRDLYPVTGSLGISLTTGNVVPGNVGGPWNAMDWTIIPNLTGVSLNGVSTCVVVGGFCQGDNTADFNSCQTVSNTSVWYTGLGMGVSNMHDTLMKNVAVAYQGDDQYDNYSSWDMTWDSFKAYNPLNNGLAFHPDFMQGGITGINAGTMWNSVFNAGQLYSATDNTIINDPGWTDMNGGTKPLSGGPQGISASGAFNGIPIHKNVTITNSLLITTACLGITVESHPSGTVDIENNTLIWPGKPSSGVSICSTSPDITPHVSPVRTLTETIIMRNNVAHSYSVGGGVVTCPLGSNAVFSNNRIVESNAGGTYHFTTSAYCPDGAAPGSAVVIGAPPSSIFGGGITYAGSGDPSLSFVAYPASNLLGDGKVLNLNPLAAGPLDGTGTTNALCCNVLGATRVPPPNIGAY